MPPKHGYFYHAYRVKMLCLRRILSHGLYFNSAWELFGWNKSFSVELSLVEQLGY